MCACVCGFFYLHTFKTFNGKMCTICTSLLVQGFSWHILQSPPPFNTYILYKQCLYIRQTVCRCKHKTYSYNETEEIKGLYKQKMNVVKCFRIKKTKKTGSNIPFVGGSSIFSVFFYVFSFPLTPFMSLRPYTSIESNALSYIFHKDIVFIFMGHYFPNRSTLNISLFSVFLFFCLFSSMTTTMTLFFFIYIFFFLFILGFSRITVIFFRLISSASFIAL